MARVSTMLFLYLCFSVVETQWTVADLEAPIAQAGWLATDRLTIAGRQGEVDAVWVFAPASSATSVSHPDSLIAPAETIKLSIIMPTYRRAHAIFRTIGAIRAQTYSNWELIVIDNAGDGATQDQRYFQRIIALNRWSEKAGDIVILREALCRANSDRRGGLRGGNL